MYLLKKQFVDDKLMPRFSQSRLNSQFPLGHYLTLCLIDSYGRCSTFSTFKLFTVSALALVVYKIEFVSASLILKLIYVYFVVVFFQLRSKSQSMFVGEEDILKHGGLLERESLINRFGLNFVPLFIKQWQRKKEKIKNLQT